MSVLAPKMVTSMRTKIAQAFSSVRITAIKLAMAQLCFALVLAGDTVESETGNPRGPQATGFQALKTWQQLSMLLIIPAIIYFILQNRDQPNKLRWFAVGAFFTVSLILMLTVNGGGSADAVAGYSLGGLAIANVGCRVYNYAKSDDKTHKMNQWTNWEVLKLAVLVIIAVVSIYGAGQGGKWAGVIFGLYGFAMFAFACSAIDTWRHTNYDTDTGFKHFSNLFGFGITRATKEDAEARYLAAGAQLLKDTKNVRKCFVKAYTTEIDDLTRLIDEKDARSIRKNVDPDNQTGALFLQSAAGNHDNESTHSKSDKRRRLSMQIKNRLLEILA